MTDQSADSQIHQNDQALPTASFLNFLSGLGSQALMQLGEIPNPMTGQREENLPFARYTMEVLQILRDKTKGNLEADEEQYLNTMIMNLEQKLGPV